MDEVYRLQGELAMLKAENARMREALERMADTDCECGMPCDCYSWTGFVREAKEALKTAAAKKES